MYRFARPSWLIERFLSPLYGWSYQHLCSLYIALFYTSSDIDEGSNLWFPGLWTLTSLYMMDRPPFSGYTSTWEFCCSALELVIPADGFWGSLAQELELY